MEVEGIQIKTVQDEYARTVHENWLYNNQTKSFLSNLEKRRQIILAQAEDFANSPATPNNLAHMQNLLVMARTIRIETIEYAKQIQSITRP